MKKIVMLTTVLLCSTTALMAEESRVFNVGTKLSTLGLGLDVNWVLPGNKKFGYCTVKV